MLRPGRPASTAKPSASGPAAVLSRSGTDLGRLSRQIAEGLELSRVGLRLDDGPEFWWPLDAGPAARASRHGVRSFEVLLAGEVIGALTVDAGALRRLGARPLRELADVVDLLGPLLQLARLEQQQAAAHASARAHAERIAATRRQAFAERDQERRDLERDLHDGAQHHLVALKMGLALLDVQLESGNLAAAGTGLDRLRSGIEQTEQTLLSTAAGSCPPVLIDHGLVAALGADFGAGPDRSGPVQLLAQPGPGLRFPLAVETAAYFTCLEAVNNARKHAPGAQIIVQVNAGPQGLAFAVTDDGPGLDPADLADSFGLGNMRARVEAAGGRLDLRTAAGVGTAIEGFIPRSG